MAQAAALKDWFAFGKTTPIATRGSATSSLRPLFIKDELEPAANLTDSSEITSAWPVFPTPALDQALLASQQSGEGIRSSSLLTAEPASGHMEMAIKDHFTSLTGQPTYQYHGTRDNPWLDHQGWSPACKPLTARDDTHTISPLTLDALDSTSFMDQYPKGNATISYCTADSESIHTISSVNVCIVEQRSPLLGASFEESSSSGPALFLNSLTSLSALPFVRYLYTGSYAMQVVDGHGFEDVPTDLLLHCQLFRLGALYDLPELKTQAYVNVLRQCEFGCSSPDKPIELCAAIKYLYTHLRTKHGNVVEAVINYCVSCFLRHRLGSDPDFCELAYNLHPFHQDLCSNLRDREFQDDTAAAIIRMPFETYIPQSMYSLAARTDVVYQFHGDNEASPSPPKRRKCEEQNANNTGAAAVLIDGSCKSELPLRPKLEGQTTIGIVKNVEKQKLLESLRTLSQAWAEDDGSKMDSIAQSMASEDPFIEDKDTRSEVAYQVTHEQTPPPQHSNAKGAGLGIEVLSPARTAGCLTAKDIPKAHSPPDFDLIDLESHPADSASVPLSDSEWEWTDGCGSSDPESPAATAGGADKLGSGRNLDEWTLL